MEFRFSPDQRTFYFLGQVRVQVISGSISILGRIFSSSHDSHAFNVFSPKSTALMSIEAVDGTGEVVLELTSLTGNGLELLHGCQPNFTTLFKPENEHYNCFDEIVPGFFCLRPDLYEILPLLRISDEWKQVVQGIKGGTSGRPIIFVCGHRKVGKSTFSRFLVNSLLNEWESVDLIDLDPGQTEFTTPGFLSRKRFYLAHGDALVGPPFTHLSLCDDSVYLASSSPADIPKLYCKAIQTLKTNLTAEGPVVINMMGWMTGLGMDFVQFAMQIFSPTHIVAFTEVESDGVDVFRKASSSPCSFDFGTNRILSMEDADSLRIFYMSNPTGEGPRNRFSPSDLRNLSYWSYFFGEFNSKSLQIDRFAPNIPSSIPALQPYLSSLKPHAVPLRILQLATSDREINLRELISKPKALKSLLLMRLVGLAVDSSFSPRNELNVLSSKKMDSIGSMRCFGVGMIRSIVTVESTGRIYSTTSKSFNPVTKPAIHLHIITPLPLEILKKVNTLILGSQAIPMQLLTGDQPTLQVEGAFYSTQSDVVGSSVRKPRHNMRRK